MAPAELTREEDAYGQLYLAVLEGRPTEEVMERDDGVTYDPAAYFAPDTLASLSV